MSQEDIFQGYPQGYLHALSVELIRRTYPWGYPMILEDALGEYYLDLSAGLIRWTYPLDLS
jgi:hypothetical protein